MNENIGETIDRLLAETSLSLVIKPWLNTMKESYCEGSSIVEINDANYAFELFQTHSDKKYSRPFMMATAELTVFPTCELFKAGHEQYDSTFWMAIERCSIDEGRRKRLFDKMSAGADDTFCVIYSELALYIPSGTNVSIPELYAYALSYYLNQGKQVNMPTELTYSFTPPFVPAFNYKTNVVYQQYYDIYDVLDEWIRSDNLLEAFLKMYQITEYIVFRHEFKAIIDNATLKQSFLQQVKKLNNKDGERSTYLRVFPTIFTGFAATCQSLLANVGDTAGAEDFIKNYLSKDKAQSYLRNGGQSADEFNKNIPQFIYDMRCCIVHNKEAEFHITPHNISVYKSVLPLMKEILKLMGEKIVTLVNDPASAIKYNIGSLPLY